MTSEIEDAMAWLKKPRENLTGLHDPPWGDFHALSIILSALAASQAEVERLTRERDEALREMGRYAAEAGEAKGRLEMSEAAGIVDGWRERAEAAEARAIRAEALVKEAGRAFAAIHVFAQDGITDGRLFGGDVGNLISVRDAASDFLDRLKGEG